MNVSHRSIFILLLLVALLGQTAQTSAQGLAVDVETNLEGGSLLLSRPETNHFPTINFRFDVYESDGAFVSGLKPSDITVIEDTSELQPESLTTTKNGVQTILVLNLGPE
ncbi:MAG TPA: hypothetical protein VEA58_05060, partial [Anaerovoracaceae bacterium]|nr:hypothetical protein [Anaerovoracaceae bacterium]